MVLQGLYGKVHHRRKGEPITRRWAEALALIVFFAIFGVVGLVGLDEIAKKGEKTECLTWKEQARQSPNFYLVGWQADQCRAVGVSVDGIPVRR
ncbi:MAG: hypothetical protein Q8P04_02250 [bacterium]|nr:hypothetical protein [bacterium]